MRLPLPLLAAAIFAAGCSTAPRTEFAEAFRKEDFSSAPKTETLRGGENRPGIRSLFFTGADYHWRSTKVFAYLGLPKTQSAKPLPGIVLLGDHGESASLLEVRRWNALGYAAISIDLEGRVAGTEYGKGEAPRSHLWSGPLGADFTRADIPLKDRWPYHALTAVCRARSLLAAESGVDAAKIGVVGVGSGGTVAAIAAAMNKDFAFGAAICPRDFDGSGDGAIAPRWQLSKLKSPFLFAFDPADKSLQPTNVQRIARLARENATIVWAPSLGSKDSAALGKFDHVRSFVDGECGKGKKFPVCLWTDHTETLARAKFRLDGADVSLASFFWTSDDGDWADRKWRSFPAEGEAPFFSADIPKDAKAWYFSVFFDDGLFVSSPIDCKTLF